MNKIKFLPENYIKLGRELPNNKTIWTTYKPYFIGDLPARFGCLRFNDGEGISEWFKYKGLVYIEK